MRVASNHLKCNYFALVLVFKLVYLDLVIIHNDGPSGRTV